MKKSDLSPRWGTWFIDWYCCLNGWESWGIWHEEMYQDHEWYFDFWEEEMDSLKSIDYYWEWKKSSVLIRVLDFPFWLWWHLCSPLWTWKKLSLDIAQKLGIFNQ